MPQKHIGLIGLDVQPFEVNDHNHPLVFRLGRNLLSQCDWLSHKSEGGRRYQNWILGTTMLIILTRWVSPELLCGTCGCGGNFSNSSYISFSCWKFERHSPVEMSSSLGFLLSNILLNPWLICDTVGTRFSLGDEAANSPMSCQ